MNYLLDTHILIWHLEGNKKLNNTWREVIANPENTIFVSIISPWEMSLKAKKLHLRLPLDAYFINFEYILLDIKLSHIAEVGKLPFYHKDPFDRMLVAQAKVEKCTLITVDKKMHRYDVPIFDKRSS